MLVTVELLLYFVFHQLYLVNARGGTSSLRDHQLRSGGFTLTTFLHSSVLAVSLLLLRLALSNDTHHLGLQLLLVLAQSVLLPGVIHDLGVKVVAGHAVFKQANAVFVVGLAVEFQSAAVLHELLEFGGVALAELLKGCLDLLLLDGRVLLVLGASGKALPGQASTGEIQKDVSNGL